MLRPFSAFAVELVVPAPHVIAVTAIAVAAPPEGEDQEENQEQREEREEMSVPARMVGIRSMTKDRTAEEDPTDEPDHERNEGEPQEDVEGEVPAATPGRPFRLERLRGIAGGKFLADPDADFGHEATSSRYHHKII